MNNNRSFWPTWQEMLVLELGKRAASCWVAVYRYDGNDAMHMKDHL